MPALAKLFWQLVGKLKQRRRPRKKLCLENKAKYNNFVEIKALDKNLIIRQPEIRIESLYNLLLV